jgi:hypothetical protein
MIPRSQAGKEEEKIYLILQFFFINKPSQSLKNNQFKNKKCISSVLEFSRETKSGRCVSECVCVCVCVCVCRERERERERKKASELEREREILKN